MVMQMEAAGILEEFIANRSPELREKLVLQSVPLVHYLLGRMGITQERGCDYEDLAHQGLMGLIDAVDHYDPKFNTKFSTYASLRIRGKIMDYLRTTDWMPRSARKRSRIIQKSITTLWSENSREPSEGEIASNLGIDVEDLRVALAYDINTSSLNNVTSSVGGFELAASYIIKVFKKPNVPPAILCPEF